MPVRFGSATPSARMTVPDAEETTQPREWSQDLDLAAELLAGDDKLFAVLVDSWSPAMLRIARAHVSNQHSAEDVVQEAWIAALRGLGSFQGRSSLRTWICGIVLNIARRQGSRDHRILLMADPTEPTVSRDRFQGPDGMFPGGWKEFPARWPSAEDAVVGAEIREVVESALGRLPERQRLVMELRDIRGFDSQEVADLLEISAGNQRVLLHRARASVRRELELYFAEERA